MAGGRSGSRGRPRRRSLRRARGPGLRPRPARPVHGRARRPGPGAHTAAVHRNLRVLPPRAHARKGTGMTAHEPAAGGRRPAAADMDVTPAPGDSRVGDVVPFGDAVRTWFAISLQTFGGPAGQIAVMQRTLVEEKRWIGQRRFLHALSYCTLLPGPEAQQLAIYVGWLLNGVRGGLVAGVLFVLPGVVALLGLSALYVTAGDSTLVTGLLSGLAPAVLAIVAQAVFRVAGRALGHPALVGVAVAAFVALAVFAVPFQ